MPKLLSIRFLDPNMGYPLPTSVSVRNESERSSNALAVLQSPVRVCPLYQRSNVWTEPCHLDKTPIVFSSAGISKRPDSKMQTFGQLRVLAISGGVHQANF